MFTSSAPGKLVLLGEYAVLENSPALVAAINKRAKVLLQKSSDNYFYLSSPSLNVSHLKFFFNDKYKIIFEKQLSSELRKKLIFFTETLEYLKDKFPPFHKIPPVKILIDTNEFYLLNSKDKLGLGSSAALTVCLVNGLLSYVSHNEKYYDLTNNIFPIALNIHHKAQGKRGSGVDVAASCFGGIIKFQKRLENKDNSPEISKLALPNDLKIHYIWSGRSSSTSKMVENVKHFKKLNPIDYNRIIDNMTLASEEGCIAIQEKKTDVFLEKCDHYFFLMKELGQLSGVDIISPIHQEIANLVQRRGGVYKPSGAGGGDIGLALSDSKQTHKKVYEEILRSGFQILNLRIDRHGVISKVKNIYK
jgi:phosphomevalonate kinase